MYVVSRNYGCWPVAGLGHYGGRNACWPVGLGEIAPSHWNEKYPNVCKPMDFETLAIFKDLQNQINRLAASRIEGMTKVIVDGDIGPKTVTNVSAGARQFPHTLLPPADCNSVARFAAEWALMFKNLADSRGAPAKVAGKAPPPVVTAPEPTIVTAEPEPGKLPAMRIAGMPLMPLLLIGGLGALLFLTKKKEKKKRAPAKRRAKARRRPARRRPARRRPARRRAARRRRR